jgi:mannose-6-phosphate isomerase-like protein (cupin superfamily)
LGKRHVCPIAFTINNFLRRSEKKVTTARPVKQLLDGDTDFLRWGLGVTRFETRAAAAEPDLLAPDGMEVRLLATTAGGSMAHFRLAPGQCALAVTHRMIEELWYCVNGRGEMWRRQGEAEETVALRPGVSVSIPLGTHFQVRAAADEAIEAVAVTMPPWPGGDEAVRVDGIWDVTVAETRE